jgi:GAF domain-containing protein
VSTTPDQRPTRPTADRRFLQDIIRTVSSTLELDRVLGAIVDLLTEATGCHACYVFLADDRGKMALRACSAQYARFVGQISMAPGEGLAGWVARHREPVFITQDAASDPRMRVFEEFEEEKYQSLVSVPLLTRDGSVLGVVALHAEAPHEYSSDDAQFLLTSASLVAGAIENAQLHQDTARRVGVLERLFALATTIAAAERLETLLPEVVSRLHGLLDALACEVYLMEPDSERLVMRGAAPAAIGRRLIGLSDAVRGEASDEPLLNLPLVASGEVLGLLAVRGAPGRRFSEEEREVASTVAAQTAVAVKKIQLVERLSERNLTKDFFDDLESGAPPAAVEGRARRLRCDLAAPRVALLAASATPDGSDWGGGLEQALPAAFRGALVERSDTHLRALLPSGAIAEGDLLERLRAVRSEAAPAAAIGVSSIARGAAGCANGFLEARQALAGAQVVHRKAMVLSYEQLGPYKYLLRLASEPAGRDQHRDALRPLLAYDAEHRSQLFHTLEEYLAQRGRVASTAVSLYVHPNTLRQRLARIEAITGLDLASEDSLTLEMAMKLLVLEDALTARS